MPTDSARRIDVAFCASLARLGATGDVAARNELGSYLWPHWLDMLKGSRSLGALARSEDHVLDIATQLFAKLNEQQGHVLELYVQWQAEHHESDFGDWIRIVTANCARDYVRGQLGARTTAEGEPSPKRLLNEFVLAPTREEQGVRPPFTEEQTARELLEFAAKRLPEGHVVALSTWLEGGTFEEIEHALGLTAGQGRRLLRAAVAVLRRQFQSAISEKIDTGA